MPQLLEACRITDVKRIDELISTGSKISDAMANLIEFGHLDLAKKLISRGANINYQTGYFLQQAAYSGKLDVVKNFISLGADVEADNNLALCWAAATKNNIMIDYLISCGANVRSAICRSNNTMAIELDLLATKIILQESDYDIKSNLYKMLPKDSYAKKMIDRIMTARAISSQRLHKSLMPYDISIVCHD